MEYTNQRIRRFLPVTFKQRTREVRDEADNQPAAFRTQCGILLPLHGGALRAS